MLTRRSDIPFSGLGSRPVPASSSRMQPFFRAAIAAAVPLAVITIWLALQIGGERVTGAVRDISQLGAAAAAVTSCLLMARRSAARTQRAWILLAASAGSALLGELAEAVYTVVLGRDVPLPSPADLGILGAIPFAVAGLESFPTATGPYASGRRWVLDAAMVAMSLLFVSWAFGLDQIYRHAASPLSGWIAIAYPVGDIVIATAIVVALRQSIPAERARLVLIVAGLALNAFFDSASALLAANGNPSTFHDLLAAGSMYGYTMVALAPLYPANSRIRDETEIALWRVSPPPIRVPAGWRLLLLSGAIRQYHSSPRAPSTSS